VATLESEVLGNFMTEANKGRYYSNGEWHAPSPVPGCWLCFDGAATAAAVLGRRQAGGDPALFPVAEATFDHAIATEQLSDGAFQVKGEPNQVATGMEIVELGITYLELRDQLDPQTRIEWATAIERAADYLIQSGATTWYINGNVQIRQVEDMWLAWKITGDEHFERSYESEWSFTIAPPRPRWTGFGLQITQQPSRADGSDGAAYLAESGSGAPGFDPEYTTSQLDGATSLWVLTHEERYLRLMNLLFNQLRPLVSSNGILDARNGTRKSSVLPFFSMGPAILLESNHRPDLSQFVSVQLALVTKEYLNPSIYSNLNAYRGLGTWLSMPLLYEQWPEGLDSPAVSLLSTTTRPTSRHTRASAREARPGRSSRGRDHSRRLPGSHLGKDHNRARATTA
jgi:hypothetical protein